MSFNGFQQGFYPKEPAAFSPVNPHKQHEKNGKEAQWQQFQPYGYDYFVNQPQNPYMPFVAAPGAQSGMIPPGAYFPHNEQVNPSAPLYPPVSKVDYRAAVASPSSYYIQGTINTGSPITAQTSVHEEEKVGDATAKFKNQFKLQFQNGGSATKSESKGGNGISETRRSLKERDFVASSSKKSTANSSLIVKQKANAKPISITKSSTFVPTSNILIDSSDDSSTEDVDEPVIEYKGQDTIDLFRLINSKQMLLLKNEPHTKSATNSPVQSSSPYQQKKTKSSVPGKIPMSSFQDPLSKENATPSTSFNSGNSLKQTTRSTSQLFNDTFVPQSQQSHTQKSFYDNISTTVVSKQKASNNSQKDKAALDFKTAVQARLSSSNTPQSMSPAKDFRNTVLAKALSKKSQEDIIKNPSKPTRTAKKTAQPKKKENLQPPLGLDYHNEDIADTVRSFRGGIREEKEEYYEDDGYDQDDHDGYDEEIYNGYDGYCEEGYNGYNGEGYDEEGYDEEVYDEEGYDEEGYDEEGYDEEGYDEEGYDIEGYNGYDEEAYEGGGEGEGEEEDDGDDDDNDDDNDDEDEIRRSPFGEDGIIIEVDRINKAVNSKYYDSRSPSPLPPPIIDGNFRPLVEDSLLDNMETPPPTRSTTNTEKEKKANKLKSKKETEVTKAELEEVDSYTQKPSTPASQKKEQPSDRPAASSTSAGKVILFGWDGREYGEREGGKHNKHGRPSTRDSVDSSENGERMRGFKPNKIFVNPGRQHQVPSDSKETLSTRKPFINPERLAMLARDSENGCDDSVSIRGGTGEKKKGKQKYIPFEFDSDDEFPRPTPDQQILSDTDTSMEFSAKKAKKRINRENQMRRSENQKLVVEKESSPPAIPSSTNYKVIPSRFNKLEVKPLRDEDRRGFNHVPSGFDHMPIPIPVNYKKKNSPQTVRPVSPPLKDPSKLQPKPDFSDDEDFDF